MTKDVMVNIAVTLVPRKNGIQLLAEKDQELCQFAFEMFAQKIPYPEHHIRRGFDEMEEHLINRMRSAGLIKP